MDKLEDATLRSSTVLSANGGGLRFSFFVTFNTLARACPFTWLKIDLATFRSNSRSLSHDNTIGGVVSDLHDWTVGEMTQYGSGVNDVILS